MKGADGISEEVLYRGPFTALPQNHRPKETPYSVSDEALGLVEELGIWDISHASAFELGRLLALQDTAFTSSMHQWITESRKQKLDDERNERLRNNSMDIDSIAEIMSNIDISNVAGTVDKNTQRLGTRRRIDADHETPATTRLIFSSSNSEDCKNKLLQMFLPILGSTEALQ